MGDELFKDRYLENFQINKEVKVADCFTVSGGILHWHTVFIQAVHDWELNHWIHFLDDLYSVQLCQH